MRVLNCEERLCIWHGASKGTIFNAQRAWELSISHIYSSGRNPKGHNFPPLNREFEEDREGPARVNRPSDGQRGSSDGQTDRREDRRNFRSVDALTWWPVEFLDNKSPTRFTFIHWISIVHQDSLVVVDPDDLLIFIMAVAQLISTWSS